MTDQPETSDSADSEHWRRYYDVTVDRPAWETVRIATSNFAVEDTARAEEGNPGDARDGNGRLAVDLGCGAGRDARELLRSGWSVLAIDRESSGLRILEAKTPRELRHRLVTQTADLAQVEVPAADLVNASLSLPFVAEPDFWSAWRRMLAAIRPGGRVSAMVFGDRDESVGDPQMTFVHPADFRATLEPDFEIEHWADVEEDTTMALGQPHHLHRVDVVARRIPSPAEADRTDR